jgi:Ca-activated chloride channel family protein
VNARLPALIALLAGATLAQSAPPAVVAAPAAFAVIANSAQGQADDARAPLSERLGWNARERTASGARALARGNAAGARLALDSALRLRPGDPVSRYNAGTGRLAEGDPSAGVLLDLAAREASPEVASSAWYNLGDARLAANEFRGAADAFVESLKLRPDHAGAKKNLELALRALEKQRQEKERQQQQQQQQQQENQEEQEKRPGGNPQTPDENQKKEESKPGEKSGSGQEPSDAETRDPSDRPKDGKKDEERPAPRPSDPGQAPEEAPKEAPSQLPKFRDLPDMSAEQASSILRAVENLERQQRKERAAKRAKAARAAVEIDW